MKVIVDISEEEIINNDGAIRPTNVIPIPNNATNGDVIKAMFPNMKVDISGGAIRADRYTQFDLNWWNAPYKGVN